MQAAAIQMVSDAEEEKDEDEDPQAAARLKALSQMTVMSHGSTGVPGGLPKRPDPPQPPDGGGDLPPMPEAPPQPVIRRTSYGTVPSQGTLQPDGSFVLGGSTPPDTVPAKEGAKVTHTKTTERTTTVEPAKPHEHKPHEVHRPHETHKPSEHKK